MDSDYPFLQNIIQKTKDRTTRTPLKTQMVLKVSSFCSTSATVVLLLLQTLDESCYLCNQCLSLEVYSMQLRW